MKRIVLTVVAALGLIHAAGADYWSEFEAGIEAYAEGRHAAAVRHLRPLAEDGDDRAQYWLGVMYLEGKGVPRDDVQAYVWFNRAAAQGNRAARLGRDRVARRLSPAQMAEAERMAAAARQSPAKP